MSPEEFRRYGHEAIDWVADYLAHSYRYPVLSRNQPGELTDSLPHTGPEQGESMDRILADFHRHILPAITHWNHPGFMAYFANSSTPPGIIAELLTAGINAQG